MKKILLILAIFTTGFSFAQKPIYGDLNVFGKTTAKDTLIIEKGMRFPDGSIQTIAGIGSSVFVFTENAVDPFTDTSYTNLANRIRIASVIVSKISDIEVTGLINRVQHSLNNSPIFARIRLGTPTPQYSPEFSLSNTFGWDFVQMKLEGYFTNVPPGTYDVEIELKVKTGQGSILDDSNGPGTRFLKAVVRPQ